MEFFEKNISNLVQSQFPSFYNEEGQQFIEFVKEYYKWMESSNNTLYHSRRLMEYGDVDATVDGFLLYFKSKYLNSLQFETATNTRQLIKHSLDLYRSKGTERAIDLFFKSVFGKPAEVYFPGDDMFKLSNGEWTQPKYLEVLYEDNLKNFINLQIEGINSGATAFVEKYIRKKIKGRYIEVYYISNIVGTFEAGEKIKSSSTGEIGPTILGSLYTLDVIDGASGYAIGDMVELTSNNGIGAKARVSNIVDLTGVVTFSLIESGWGYNANSIVIISDSVLNINNISLGTNNNANLTFNQFETIIQPKANIEFTSNTATTLSVGDFIYRYDSNTEFIESEAQIMSVNSTSNQATVAVLDGYFPTTYSLDYEDDTQITFENNILMSLETETWSNTFFTLTKLYTENNLSLETEDGYSLLDEDAGSEFEITAYTDETAYANVMTASTNTFLSVSNSFVQFNQGDIVYELVNGIEVANGRVESIAYNSTNALMRLSNTYGTFSQKNTLLSKNNAATGYINNINLDVAVHDVNGDFEAGDYSFVYGYSSNTNGYITRVGRGSGATLSLNDLFLYNESNTFNVDLIKNYVDVALNDADYGFTNAFATDIDSVIGIALNYEELTFGSLGGITITGVGIDYDNIPYVLVYEPYVYNFNKHDFRVNIANTNGNFAIGEVVQQSGLNKGIIKEGSNSSVLLLKRITLSDNLLENNILVFEDSNTFITESSNTLMTEHADLLVGVDSGATATVVIYEQDFDTPRTGLNAIITANVVTSSGSISELEVIDSGYGHYQNEIVSFGTGDGLGYARVNLSGLGISEGFYRRNDSLLSADKYIQDSEYYQEFSYEIQSAVTLDKYSGMLKNILHIAGTKYFSKYMSQTMVENGLSTQGVTYSVANNDI